MTLSITALYAGILALIVVALAVNVTVHRVKLRVPLGDGGNPDMLRMIRLHGNAVEYLPLALVLMAVYEINGGWHIGAARRRHRAGGRRACCKPGACGRRDIQVSGANRPKPDLAVDRGARRAEFVELM